MVFTLRVGFSKWTILTFFTASLLQASPIINFDRSSLEKDESSILNIPALIDKNPLGSLGPKPKAFQKNQKPAAGNKKQENLTLTRNSALESAYILTKLINFSLDKDGNEVTKDQFAFSALRNIEQHSVYFRDLEVKLKKDNIREFITAFTLNRIRLKLKQTELRGPNNELTRLNETQKEEMMADAKKIIENQTDEFLKRDFIHEFQMSHTKKLIGRQMLDFIQLYAFYHSNNHSLEGLKNKDFDEVRRQHFNNIMKHLREKKVERSQHLNFVYQTRMISLIKVEVASIAEKTGATLPNMNDLDARSDCGPFVLELLRAELVNLELVDPSLLGFRLKRENAPQDGVLL